MLGAVVVVFIWHDDDRSGVRIRLVAAHAACHTELTR